MFEESEEQIVRAWSTDQVGRELEELRAELRAELTRKIPAATIDGEDQVMMSFIRWGGISMVAACLAMGTCAGTGNLGPAKPEPLSKVEQCSKACNGQMAKWSDISKNPEACECKAGAQPIESVRAPISGGPVLNPLLNPRVNFGDSRSFYMNNGQKAELSCRSDGTCMLMETKE